MKKKANKRGAPPQFGPTTNFDRKRALEDQHVWIHSEIRSTILRYLA